MLKNKVSKILFLVIVGILIAGFVNAGLSRYWKTVKDIIPRIDNQVNIGSDTKRVKDYYGYNVNLADDSYLYFDTAKSIGVKYSSGHAVGLVFPPIYYAEGVLILYSNSGADGLGKKDPWIRLSNWGFIELTAHEQGSPGSRYVKIYADDGMKLRTTGGYYAVIKADNVTTSDKTFQFPNHSGNVLVDGADIDLGAYDLTIGGTLWIDNLFRHIDDPDTYFQFSPDEINWYVGGAYVVRLYEGAQDKVTIGCESGVDVSLANDKVYIEGDTGNVGIGTTGPDDALDVAGNIDATGVYELNNATVLSNAGTGNILVGVKAGASNTGGYNTFVGYMAGYSNTTGDYNTFIGTAAGYYNTGRCNTFIGEDAGFYNTTGQHNTFIGRYASLHNITGDYNIALGEDAGYDNITGQYNIYLGYQAGYSNSTGDSNVFLGYKAGWNETDSNKLYIDNSNTSTPLIYGDFATDTLTINDILIAKAYNISTKKCTVTAFTDEGINSCIDALGSDGGEVYMPEGEYAVNAQITIDYDNTTLRGAGSGTILKVPDATNSSDFKIINLGSKNNCVLTNFKIDGNKANNTGEMRGIYLNGGANHKLINLWIYNIQGSLGGVGGDGIFSELTATPANILIQGCTVDNVDDDGMDINAMIKSEIVGNYIRTCGDNGIDTEGSEYVTISGNVIDTCSGHGIELEQEGLGLTKYCTVTGNTIRNITLNGIHIESGGYNSVTGNTIQQTGYGIRLAKTGSGNNAVHNVISGNMIKDTTYAGIKEISGQADYNLIVGNKITDAGTANLSLQGAATHALYIGSPNGFIFNQDVGIGSLTTPGNTLHVVGDSKFGDDNTNYMTIGTDGSVSFTGTAGFEMPNGATIPATCSVGQMFLDTDSDDCADTGGGDGCVCICKSSDTWVILENI